MMSEGDMLKSTRWLAVALLVASGAVSEADAKRELGILNQKAPSWSVDQWLGLPDGKKVLDVADFKGKVLYLYCFQSWCPGCHSHGFPTLQKAMNHFKGDEEVAFVAVQTVFEGFSSNTLKRAGETAARYDLDIPIGHSGSAGQFSSLMRNYRTGGTPWTIIIDKQGVVRFNGFRIEAEDAIHVLAALKVFEGRAR